MTLRAGLLRHRITIRRAQQLQNAKGGYDSTWLTIATPKARLEGLDGRESTLASTLQGISAWRITIRWRAGILQSDQIVLDDGTELNVVSAADPDGKRERLIILADTGSVRRDEAGG